MGQSPIQFGIFISRKGFMSKYEYKTHTLIIKNPDWSNLDAKAIFVKLYTR